MNIVELLREYTTSRTEFSQILNDESLRMGFECEVITDIPKYSNSDWEEPDYDEMDWDELREAEGVRISPNTEKHIKQSLDEWLTDSRRAEWRETGDAFVKTWCAAHEAVNPSDPANRNRAFHEWLAQTHDRFAETHSMDAYIRAHYSSNRKFMEDMGIEVEAPEEEHETNVWEACAHVARALERSDLDIKIDRGDNPWSVEEDASVSDNEYVGVEVVSGVYSLKEGLAKMAAFFQWMDNHHYFTNRTTGLHVSFSIEGITSDDDYDFLKMMMLFDENYTASLFGRMENKYAKQMRSVLFGDLQSLTWGSKGRKTFDMLSSREMDRISAALKKIGKSLGSNLGSEKYYSFRHRADGVVEFRNMGGADYNRKFEIIRKRVINMAYMMKVGADDHLMQREYLKRIYQMLSGDRFRNPSLQRTTPYKRMPDELNAFATLFRANPILFSLYETKRFDHLVAKLFALRMSEFTAPQNRQLRFFIAKHKISSDTVRVAFDNDAQYNQLAALMHWPLVVPGVHDERQEPLPFAHRGKDLSGVPAQQILPTGYDKSRWLQRVLPLDLDRDPGDG